MGKQGRAMALRTLHVLLAVVAVSVSVEHVAGYMEPPEEDMSMSTGSDGEVRMGHYGDYSDWVMKYHHTNKVAKVASVPPSSQAKQVAKKAEKPVKKVKVKTVKKAAKQTKTAHKAKKQSAKKVKEAAPSVVDELESELSGLEHKAAAPAPSANMVHKKSAQRPKSELAESKDDTVSLDSLEASLDKLEAVPTEMLELPTTHRKSLASYSSSDTMGAAYRVTQESLHLHNFPNVQRLKQTNAVKAFQKVVKVAARPQRGNKMSKRVVLGDGCGDDDVNCSGDQGDGASATLTNTKPAKNEMPKIAHSNRQPNKKAKAEKAPLRHPSIKPNKQTRTAKIELGESNTKPIKPGKTEKDKIGERLEQDAAKYLKQKSVSLDEQLDELAKTTQLDLITS